MIQEGGEAHISGQIARYDLAISSARGFVPIIDEHSIYKDLENQEKKQADDIKEIQSMWVTEHEPCMRFTDLFQHCSGKSSNTTLSNI